MKKKICFLLLVFSMFGSVYANSYQQDDLITTRSHEQNGIK